MIRADEVPAQLTHDEAQQRFATQLEVACPVCDAEVNDLCDTPGVWIHFERFKLAEDR